MLNWQTNLEGSRVKEGKEDEERGVTKWEGRGKVGLILIEIAGVGGWVKLLGH